MIASLDLREPRSVVSVEPKIFGTDYMGGIVWCNLSHNTAKLLQNLNFHKYFLFFIKQLQPYRPRTRIFSVSAPLAATYTPGTRSDRSISLADETMATAPRAL